MSTSIRLDRAATPGHRIADVVAFVCIILAVALPLVLARDSLGQNVILTIAVVMCCVFAAAMRITISSVGSILTIGFSPLPLALFTTHEQHPYTFLVLWALGTIAGSTWALRGARAITTSAIATSLSGVVFLLARGATPSVFPHSPVWNPDGELVPVLVGLLAYFLSSGLVSILIAHLVTRVPLSQVIVGIGWMRVGLAFALQAVLSVLVLAVASAWGQQHIFQALSAGASGVTTILVITTTTALVGGSLRTQVLRAKERSIVAACMAMPWSPRTPIRDQAAQRLQSALPDYHVRTSALSAEHLDPSRPREPVRESLFGGTSMSRDLQGTGHAIASSVIEGGEQPFRLVVERRAWQRPFTLSDRNLVEALASIARESLRVDKEMQRLRTASDSDTLTGLLNYRAFRVALEETVERNDLGFVAILFIDVDDLHHINDRHGREAGNEVLSTLAQRLRETVPSTDVSARVGGDEFAVLVVSAARRSEVERLGADLEAVLAQPVVTQAGRIPVSVSLGISYSRPDDSDLTLLLHEADQRMYAASGALAPPPASDTAEQQGTGALAHLDRAIVRGRLQQVYRPIVECSSMRIVGLEALVRHTDPDQGPLPAELIVGEAERLGLADQLSLQVLTHSLEDMERIAATTSEPLCLHLNVGIDQLTSETFTASARDLLASHPGVEVVLEASASSLRRADVEVVQDAARWVAGAPVGLAIDDMGTDYSEFRVLAELPVGVVKVGRRMTANLRSPRIRQALEGLGRLSGHMDFRIILDGIDTPEQADQVGSLGVSLVQGDFYARPVGVEEFLLRLDSLGTRVSPVSASRGVTGSPGSRMNRHR